MAGKKEIKLVPVEEQPYEIPQNWCWTKLGSLVSASKERTEDFSDSNVRYVGLEHMEKDAGIIGYSSAADIRSLKSVFHKGQILYGKLRPYLNKHDVAYFDGICSTDILVFEPSKAVLPEYINFFLHQRNFIEYAVANSKGINLPRVSESVVSDAVCPLPPLAEQERIVATINKLFADLDKAAENAQKIIDIHKAKKESILYQAFSGELTSQWRKKNGLSYGEWQSRTLDEVSYSIYDGDHMPPPKAENGVPFLMISNVNTGYLSFDKTKYVTQEYYDNLSETRKPRCGDVLYTLVGSYGIPVIVDVDAPFCFQRHMAVIKPKAVDTRFLWYQMQSQEIFNKATSIATGTAQLTVPIKGLRQMTIKVPTLAEQQEIVRILDELLTNEQRIKEAAEEMLDKIAMMKKSILADAFRGKLGTNDPADEPATELLKQILS